MKDNLTVLPTNWQHRIDKSQVDVFENLVENMGKFRPIALDESTKTTHFDPESPAEMHCDGMYRIFYCDRFHAFPDLTFYAYRILVEREIIEHRLGGPCQYQYNSLTGRLENLEFYYMGNEMSEIEYWEYVASLDVGVIDNDFYKNHNGVNRVGKKYKGKTFKYKTEIAFDNFLIRYYLKTKSFSYFINGKKENRSTFYKVTEQRISRIRV